MYIQHGPGSAGNVIAALASFFVPGLGQLLQGRLLKAFFFFVLAAVMWLLLLGWLVHIWAILDAATFCPRRVKIAFVSPNRQRADQSYYYFG